MRTLLFVGLIVVALVGAQTGTTVSHELRIFIQGDSARLPDFVEDLRREFNARNLIVKLVERGAEYDYNVVLAQESTMGSAAAAVVVLDRNAGFVTSVVRSGRFTGKGAFNASAKELAKKIAILRGVKAP